MSIFIVVKADKPMPSQGNVRALTGEHGSAGEADRVARQTGVPNDEQKSVSVTGRTVKQDSGPNAYKRADDPLSKVMCNIYEIK